MTATPCIEWAGHISAGGYGVTANYMGTRQVHRVTWMKAHGPLEPGQVVCHRCDNRRCYNLDHLFVGTQKDNVDDAMRKGRHKPVSNGNAQKTHCLRGHPFSGDNLHVSPLGARRCKACRRSYYTPVSQRIRKTA